MRNSKGVTRRALWLVGLLAAVLTAGIAANPQIAGATTPPGNNGTIKIDDIPFDSHPDDEPHDGCTFQVDFYGYEAGDLNADVTFEAQSPTLSPSGDQVLLNDPEVFVGEDSNAGGGSEAGLDASRTYTLDFRDITPQKNQGFHVKLTIHVTGGSQGADVKHKVFWVTGCEAAAATTTTTTTTGGGEQGGGTTTTTTTGGGGLLPTTLPGQHRGHGALPFTGANSLPTVVTGLLLLVVGAAGVLASRRMRAR